MRKYLHYYYNKLFFKAYHKGKFLPFSTSFSMKIASSSLAILWLKTATKYNIQLFLKDLYSKYLEYDMENTKGILQTPKLLRGMSLYSYLTLMIYMGWHPTLKSNPISLLEVLKLNPYKKDKKFTEFLNNLLTYHWENPNKCITKNRLNNILQHS